MTAKSTDTPSASSIGVRYFEKLTSRFAVAPSGEIFS